ncbi:MAG TPA: DUF4031 domain-containing protein [Chitinophagales bacterium]|nr:DUF4031 domain-containing protein [Chitinophagales bacterium]
MVLIGKRKYKYGRMYLSHLVSDNLNELHEVASALGINRKHFQDKKYKPHYDICQEKKKLAIKLGLAKEVDDREIIMLFRNSKT